jgi:ABC-2 type transport system permease protein
MNPSVSIFKAQVQRAWIKIRRRPVVLAFSLAQPLMWMVFFGFLFENISFEEATGRYKDYLLPGVCAMSLLFGASQAGVNQIRDLQTGFLARMLATPASTLTLLAGKNTADCLRLLLQAALIAGVGVSVGAHLNIQFVPLVGALFFSCLFIWSYASFSNWLALKTRSQEVLGVFIQVVNMPIFFTSTALVPERHMPDWLSSIARWNPLSAVADSLRSALIGTGQTPGIFAFAAMGALAVGLFFMAVHELNRTRLL